MIREEIGTSPKPEWLDLPDKAEYWVCMGSESRETSAPWWQFWRRTKSTEVSLSWRVLFYTAEEAEAHAASRHERAHSWVWDGRPAQPRSLVDAMRGARRDGDAGVVVLGFRSGRWVWLKTYRADEPLLLEDALSIIEGTE